MSQPSELDRKFALGKQPNAKKALIELGKLYELSGQPQKHVEVQSLMSETHLPAQLPAALARAAARPATTQAQ